MGRMAVVSLGLIALLILCFLCVRGHRDAIESDLVERASEELSGAGLDDVRVTAVGRDLELQGSVASPADRDRALDAARVWGVRVVDDALTVSSSAVDSSPPAATQSAAWRMEARRDDGGRLAWSGSLAASSQQRLFAESGVAPAAEGALADLAADAGGAPGERAEAALAVAMRFAETLERGEMTATPERLIVRGVPDSLRQAATVRAALEARVPAGMDLELKFDRDWTVDELSLEALHRGEAWVLQGLVPEGAGVGWLERARGAGLDPLQDRLLEAALAAPEGFGEAFGVALDTVGPMHGAGEIRDVRIVESKSGLDVSASSDATDAADRLETALRDVLPAGVALGVDVGPRLGGDQCQAALAQELAAEKILFASGSARIDAASDALLRRLASTLRRCPGPSVAVEGHTDSDGAEDFNLALSDRRAGAVLQRLVALGVDPLRLGAEGFGESRPIADGETPAAKSQNRRIEFRLHEDA